MESPTSLDSPPRLLSIDIIRGISIFGVLFIHPMIYGTWHTEALALELVPSFVLAIFAPIILVGTWGGGFPMISSVLHCYNTYNRLERGVSFKEATKPIMFSSTLILLLDPLKAFLIGRTWTNSYEAGINYSLFSRLLERQELAWPGAERVFQIGSLPAIAISGYVSVFLFWILFRNGGHRLVKRNIRIFLIIGIGMTLISYPLSLWLNPKIVALFIKGGFGNRFLAYLCRLFIGAQLSYFPMGAYAFFGLCAGYLLVRKEKFEKIKRFGLIGGCSYLGLFILTLVIRLVRAPSIFSGILSVLDYEIYPNELLFFSLGCMFLLLIWLVKRFEYISPELKLKRSRSTLFFRRFGVVTLSFYFMEPFWNGILAYVFHRLFGDVSAPFGTADAFMQNFWAILLFVFTFELFWIGISLLWAKTGYKYGFEYWIVRSTKKWRKIPSKRGHLEQYTIIDSPQESHIKREITEDR